MAAVRQFVTGAGLLGRGLGIVMSSPRLLLLGLLPALLAGVLYTIALVVLIRFLPDISGWVTSFADDWSTFWRDTMEFLAGAGVLGLAVLLGILSFTAVTLLIGDPFYERISELVEDRFGGVPDAVEVGFWSALRRSLADAVRLLGISVLVGIPLFLLGFLPVVGQTVIPVLAGAIGGWLLALELTGVPFQRRGQRLRHRRVVLAKNVPLTLGFGAAVFVAFLIPLGAVFLMPAAIAGATLLSRRTLGHPIAITTTPSL
ncbi:EI24 domain-containing protein [Actinoplanes sp. NPDC051851]|uniref:EI24 domain-containing protein n=1 Tax=Actinoplanes sp. NPDC051851 TaxID=3154753 RepID=UPI003432CBE9